MKINRQMFSDRSLLARWWQRKTTWFFLGYGNYTWSAKRDVGRMTWLWLFWGSLPWLMLIGAVIYSQL